MYLHALIIAALSVSALARMSLNVGISLTAHDHTDSTCTRKRIGNHIELSASQCKLYQPEQPDAFIKAVWVANGTVYNINLFSDTNCSDEIADMRISAASFVTGRNYDCYSMGQIAKGPWGSAMVGAEYEH